MLTKTGNWFGSISEHKPTSDSGTNLGSDFRAIPTEEDKRAMKRQGSFHRSDSGRGSLRRAKGRPETEAERAQRLHEERRHRSRRPSVSDEEVDSIHETPPGSPAYLSDDELYRADENKVRRKVVKFMGHDEFIHHPQKGYAGMQSAGPGDQGLGRGQIFGQRPGQPPQHLASGGRPGMSPGPNQSRGTNSSGHQRGGRTNFAPQQQGSSFTPVGQPGTPPTSRAVFQGMQQQGSRPVFLPMHPGPGYGRRGHSGPQQAGPSPRLQSTPQQNAMGYGRGVPVGSQTGPVASNQMAAVSHGYGRGAAPISHPNNQLNPRQGLAATSSLTVENRPRHAGPSLNHFGASQSGQGIPRSGPPQSLRPVAPQAVSLSGPRFVPGGQPQQGTPMDSQGGPYAPFRQGRAPDQPQGQLGHPRLGPSVDHPRGQISGPRMVLPAEQSRSQLGSPRLGSPRDQEREQLGSLQQGGPPGQRRGQFGPQMDQPRDKFGTSQQEPLMDQGRPHFGFSQKSAVLDQFESPDGRSGLNPDVQDLGTFGSGVQDRHQGFDNRIGLGSEVPTKAARMGPESQPVYGGLDQRAINESDHCMLKQPKGDDRQWYQRPQPKALEEEIDGRRTIPRKTSLDELENKVKMAVF